MNARVNAHQILTPKQQKELDRYIFDKGMEIYQDEATGLMRRCYKVMAAILNEKFGFGKSRLMKLFESTANIAHERQTDEIFWKHLDDVVINQIGLEFDREDYSDLEE